MSVEALWHRACIDAIKREAQQLDPAHSICIAMGRNIVDCYGRGFLNRFDDDDVVCQSFSCYVDAVAFVCNQLNTLAKEDDGGALILHLPERLDGVIDYAFDHNAGSARPANHVTEEAAMRSLCSIRTSSSVIDPNAYIAKNQVCRVRLSIFQ
jgi:hypothetical protein